MAKVVSISNQKGGVGKTTTALSLAAGLTKKGYKVLLLDLDAQTNLSITLRADLSTSNTVFKLLGNEVSDSGGETTYKITDFIQKTHSGDLIPGSESLSAIDILFVDTVGKEELLKGILEKVNDLYDFILLDTPPALNTIAINSLVASDMVLIPLKVERYSIDGLKQINKTINIVRKRKNPFLKICGLLLTSHNPRTALSKKMVPEINLIAEKLGTKVFKTYIRQSVSILESQYKRVNMLDGSPKSTSQLDYIEFIDEFLDMLGE